MTNDELMGAAHKNAQLYFSFIVYPDAPKPIGWAIYEECFIAGAKYAQQADSERVKELEAECTVFAYENARFRNALKKIVSCELSIDVLKNTTFKDAFINMAHETATAALSADREG